MQRLPVSPPPPHASRSSLFPRNRSFEIEICTEGLRELNLSKAREDDSIDGDLPPQKASRRSSASYNDGIRFSGCGDGKGLYAEKLQFRSSLRYKANAHRDDDDDDDDDDDMQWANAIAPPQVSLHSYGYGDSKGLRAANIASGKENKVRFPGKVASFPSAVAWQQHAGPIKPNTGPFSSPLRVTAKPNFAAKADMVPPVKFWCKNMLGFDVCEPSSPEVTCLGHVKLKECAHNEAVRTTTRDKPGALQQKVQKGSCFGTKSKLCGKKATNGRKKKKISGRSRCLSCRRVASKEGADTRSSLSSELGLELGETRREKAASLAKSLTGLLQDMHKLERVNAQYVPSVPPANSLLLMRGCRTREEICLPTRGDVEEATNDDDHIHNSPTVSLSLDGNGAREANVRNFRNSAPLHLSLLELIDMEDEDFFTADMKGSLMTQRTRAIAQGTFLSEKEKSNKKNDFIDGGSSLKPPPKALLWQRRAIAELTTIEVKQRTKLGVKQPIIR